MRAGGAAVLLVAWAACGQSAAANRESQTPAVPPPDAGSAPEAALADAATAREAPEVDAGLDQQMVNRPGQLVFIEDVLVPGKVTIIDFWAEWCQACKDLDKRLEAALAGVDGVALRRIDILDDSSPVAKHYDVGVLPHLRIYDRNGELTYALIGDNTLRAVELVLSVVAGE